MQHHKLIKIEALEPYLRNHLKIVIYSHYNKSSHKFLGVRSLFENHQNIIAQLYTPMDGSIKVSGPIPQKLSLK